jgi:hypothetical protein
VRHWISARATVVCGAVADLELRIFQRLQIQPLFDPLQSPFDCCHPFRNGFVHISLECFNSIKLVYDNLLTEASPFSQPLLVEAAGIRRLENLPRLQNLRLV